MKTLILTLSFLTALSSFAQDLILDRELLDGTRETFKSHQGKGEWDSYLSMELPFHPAAGFFKQLLILKRYQLANRGEAHITVVTPNEYWNKLKDFVSMSEIDAIAKKENLQGQAFEVKCLGMGELKVEEKKTERTFYLVVESKGLLDIRKKIRDLYEVKSKKKATFIPEDWYPHVTIGFTSRDLHESDGIKKDLASCHLPVILK